jgi:GMP synthase (glutamine-hydrolysing)
LPKVLVVNNYPTRERVVRLEKALERNGAAVTPGERDGASARRFGSFDGVVLSGSPDMMTRTTTQEKFEREAQAVRDSCIPVLGVCFGHQLMAHAFGAKVVRDRQHVLGMVRTTVLTRDRLFEGLPRSIMLLESRHEVVKSLPDGFSLLAKSATSGIAAMKHGTRPLYGVQFHPERYTIENPEGNRVLGNFVGLLK